MKRKPISKKVRFEVFKRDGFACQYCGRTPPTVVLHVDHIEAVKRGGSNHQDNLITSCLDCNLGKGATPLSSVPASLKDKAAEVAEREAQIKGYHKALAAKARRIENETWEVAAALEGVERVEKYDRRDLQSIKRFLERAPYWEVIDAAEKALAKFPYGDGSRFRYFCGICWRKIREAENDGARAQH